MASNIVSPCKSKLQTGTSITISYSPPEHYRRNIEKAVCFDKNGIVTGICLPIVQPAPCNSVLTQDLDTTNLAQQQQLKQKEATMMLRCRQLVQQTYTLSLLFEVGIFCEDKDYPNNKLCKRNGWMLLNAQVVTTHLDVFMTSFKGLIGLTISHIGRRIFGWTRLPQLLCDKEIEIDTADLENNDNDLEQVCALIYQQQSVFAPHVKIISQCKQAFSIFFNDQQCLTLPSLFLARYS